jgi:aminoglycoside phosphotransferase
VTVTALSDPHARSRPELVVPALGRWLAGVHASPTKGLSVVSTAELVDRAVTRLEAGEVDLSDVDRAYQRIRPATLRAQLEAGVPPEADPPVAISGSARFDSLTIDDGVVSATCPVTLAGDPYLDLASLARDLARLIGPEALWPFFDAYGLDRPDPLRLDFFMLLNALS